MDRKVLIKIIALDGTSKTIDSIGNSLKRLQQEASKSDNSSDKSGSYKSASYRAALKDIEQMRRENARREQAIANEITRGDKMVADTKTREYKRAGANVIRVLNEMRRANDKTARDSQGIFSKVLGGSFFGNLGSQAASSFISSLSILPSLITDLFAKASNYSQMSISLAQFEGSAAKAEERIKSLIAVSAATPGLSFTSAVDGQKRLEAIGFEGDQATKILTGLAKVRILSGSTKQDYDAVILNLTQIASGGQKVGQEIRELIGRMPAFASIIRKEFGTLSGEVLNKLDPKVFVERLAVATSSMNAEFASSALAAENLSDSIDRIKVATGSIIEQNPEVIALLQLWANEIDGVTASLADQDSQQRATFSSLFSWLATGAVKVQNFSEFMFAVSKDTGNGFLKIASTFAAYVDYTINKVSTSVSYTFGKLGEYINEVIRFNNSIASLTGGLVGFTQLPEFEGAKKAEDAFYANEKSFQDFFVQQNKYFETEKGFWKNARQAIVKGEDRLNEYRFLIDQNKQLLERQKTKTYERNEAGKVSNKNSSGNSGGGGKLSTAGLGAFASDRTMAQFQNSLRKLSPELRAQIVSAAESYGIPSSLALAQIFSESTFNTKAKSPYNANVKQHAFGLTQALPSTASNVMGRKVSGADLFNSETALTVWGKYMTKLFNEFGDWELAVFAYHNGEGAARAFAKALDSGNQQRVARFAKGNPKGVAYAKKISALSGLSKDEQFGVVDPEKISDTATKSEREKVTRTMIQLYKNIGMVPSEKILDEFQKLLVEDAKKLGGAQPSEADVAAMFAQNAFGKRGDIPGDSRPISTQILNRETVDQEFIRTLRERLNIEEQTTELILRQRNLQAEIVEQGAAERIGQQLELLNIERDLAVLQRQNADETFAANRRNLQVKRDEYQLQQEIIDLQDRIANISENSALRYQRAWLEAVYEVKDANIQAVEDQIRAQVHLENQMVRSNDIIRARVLDHLATQKTLNESIADGIINIYEKAATGLDKLIDKSGVGKIPILGEIAKANSRSFLTKITTGLLDKFLPSELTEKFKKTGNPVVDEVKTSNTYLKTIADAVSGRSVGNIGGGSAGGGLSNIFSQIFGGGGGIGGTAPFNPSSGIGSFLNNRNSSTSAYGGGISTNTGGVRDFAGNIIGGSSGGGFLGNLRNVFSNREGGMFAPVNGSALGGYISGGAGIANMVGGLIGGRVGGAISGAASGALMGLQIGGPWGALIGGGAGLLMSLLGGDPKRKRDKKEKLPQLQSGFTDALAQLRQLVSDTKSLRVDPDSAISKATELRQAIASGFGIQFESKKYSKQSQSQIQSKLSEADSIIAQIREAADIARTANARNNRILPEFSTGGYLPGAFDRKDDIIARLSRGEMVLNPSQMSRVKSMAGFDVFAHAGIPNYPKREAMPKFADGGMVSSFSSGNSTPNINLNLNLFEREDGGFDAYLDSDAGQRKVAVTVKKLQKNKEL